MFDVLSIRAKLSAVAAAAAIAITGLVGVHGWSSHRADAGFERLYGASLQPLVSLQAVDGPLREIRFRMAAVLLDQMPIPGSRNHLAEARPKIDAAWKHYRATIAKHGVSPEIEALATKIDAGLPGLTRVLESLEAAYVANDRKRISTILEDDWPTVHMEIVKPLEQLRPTTEQEAGAFFATASAARIKERLALAVGAGLLIFTLVVFTAITIRSVVRALRSAVVGAEALAAGDFKTEIAVGKHDEPGRVLNAVRSVRSTVEAFLDAQAEMAKRHHLGDTDYRIDAARLPGAYGELAQKVNGMVDDSVTIQTEFTALVQRYAQGDFAADMPRLPGQRAAITAAADAVKQALESLPAEVARLVAAAARGDFSVRGDVNAYRAEFRSMMQSLNNLMEISRAGLADANRMFSALARADLSPRVTSHYEGTFAELQQSANTTMEQLGALVGGIRAAADAIKEASTRIAHGNQDLSSRTEEQAASLQQAAASIEALTGTVRESAANAQAANKLAMSAVAVATRGGATVHEVVDTMAEIATSSAQVEDIIAVIDGIAFQTNILALNAAVEAARAGAEGRGFAVVATEVRNLAQRSAAAAKEIKALIAASTTKVESGTALVKAAGAQMQEIVESVDRVSAIISTIAAASVDQAAGFDQINQAVTQMDQGTQQNATLVEEAAAAAEALNRQADGLLAAVGSFNLDAAREERAAPAVRRAAPPIRAKAA